MTAPEFLIQILRPQLMALTAVLGDVPPDTPEVRLQLLAEAGQESQWSEVQRPGGSDRGAWQFLPATCGLILRHGVVGPMMRRVCAAAGIEPTEDAVYGVILTNRLVEVALAVLDLAAYESPYPAIGDEEGSWKFYVAVWRPGAVMHGGKRAAEARTRWTGNYASALAAIQQEIA